MKRYIKAKREFFSQEDTIDDIYDAINYRDDKLLSEVFGYLGDSTVIDMDCRTYRGNRYTAHIIVHENKCTLDLTYKGKPDPRRTLDFTSAAKAVNSWVTSTNGAPIHTVVNFASGTPLEFTINRH